MMRLFIGLTCLLLAVMAPAQTAKQLADRFPQDPSLEIWSTAIELPPKIAIGGHHLAEFEKKNIQQYVDYFLKDNPEGLRQAMLRQAKNMQYHEQPLMAALGVSLSGFKGNVYQLTFPVAAKYGVTMNSYIDDRYDFPTNYAAASRWLQQMSSTFATPEEVMLAFINSPGALQRAKQRSRSTKIEQLYPYLPESTRNTYFIYTALSEIYARAKFDQDRLKEWVKQQKGLEQRIEVKTAFTFYQYEHVKATNVAELKRLNPTLISAVVPQGFLLRYHHEKTPEWLKAVYDYTKESLAFGDPAEVATDSVASTVVEMEKIHYSVRKGDNLTMIAGWFDVKVAQIQEWNALSGDRVEVGQVLFLWVNEEQAHDLGKITYLSTETKNELLEHTSFIEVLKDFEYYTVKKGDSLWSISQHHSPVKAEQIMQWNGINESIEIGQKILIRTR